MNLFDDKNTPTNPSGEATGDSTVAQTIQDVKAKAGEVKLNKDGTPRKQRARKGVPDSGTPRVDPPLGQAGFTEEQVGASFKGIFWMAALSTNCNAWVLTDDEAKCFVPSTTLALNQLFPSVAQSKWGALSLASLSLGAVVIAKTVLYLDYKARLLKQPPSEVITPNPAS
jgi:hypothetical protein